MSINSIKKQEERPGENALITVWSFAFPVVLSPISESLPCRLLGVENLEREGTY